MSYLSDAIYRILSEKVEQLERRLQISKELFVTLGQESDSVIDQLADAVALVEECDVEERLNANGLSQFRSAVKVAHEIIAARQ